MRSFLRGMRCDSQIARRKIQENVPAYQEPKQLAGGEYAGVTQLV